MTTPSTFMFHHFHGPGHPPVQGSVSTDFLDALIRRIGRRNFNEPGDFNGPGWGLSFDDGLRSQYDLALEVLNKYDLRAFWFVPTAPLVGVPLKLEQYRYFRNRAFPSIEAFYATFSARVGKKIPPCPEGYLSPFPFYTPGDRHFRYLRDEVLGALEYDAIMETLLGEAPAFPSLWVTPEEVQSLARAGHVVGLHSHTHPTRLGELPLAEQKSEYETSSSILKALLGQAPKAAAHPCNSYSPPTLGVLQDLGVEYAFRADNWRGATAWELPRQDAVLWT